MAKRPLCNYANASNETAREGAIYQRGQYYIIQNNNRRGDRRRYGVYLNDDLIGLGGSLVRLKRFVNDMYREYPFETEVNEGLEKVKRFARRAQMQLRSQMTPSKTEPKPKKKSTGAKSRRRPASKKSSGGEPAATKNETSLPTMSAAQRKLVDQTTERARTGEQVQQVIQFIDQHKATPAVNRLREAAVAKRDRLRGPQQQRLF